MLGRDGSVLGRDGVLGRDADGLEPPPMFGVEIDGLLAEGLLTDGRLTDGRLTEGLLTDGRLIDGERFTAEPRLTEGALLTEGRAPPPPPPPRPRWANTSPPSKATTATIMVI